MENLQNLETGIDDNLAKLESRVTRLRRLNNMLFVLSLAAGGLSTLLAGISAVSGASIIGTGNEGWQITCGVVAVVSFLGTLVSSIDNHFRISETLSESKACAGRLASLKMQIAAGQISDAAGRYAEVLAEYHTLLK